MADLAARLEAQLSLQGAPSADQADGGNDDNGEGRPRVTLQEPAAAAALAAALEDEPLSAPANEVAGGARGFTPSRRSNNHSRPHSRGKVPGEGLDLALERPARPVSRRKERRWANDARAGAAALGSGPVRNLNMAAYETDPEEFDVAAAARLIYARDYVSGFEGFTTELRRAFMDCEGAFAPSAAAAAAAAAAGERARRTAPQTPAARFARVDKNLKHHLLQTGTREPFRTFLAHLEVLLLDALDTERTAPRTLEAPAALARTLVRPARVVGSNAGAPVVELVFKSGVHRLLTHGLCQYHGLSSHSETEVVGKGAQRVMRVQLPNFDPVMAGWVEPAVAQPRGAADPATPRVLFAGEPRTKLVPFLATLVK